MEFKHEVIINPFNEKWCRVNCENQLIAGFGNRFYCRKNYLGIQMDK